MRNAIIRNQNLSMEFGGLRALSNFDFTLDPGQLVGLIGPNGAGKTTVFNVITGVYAPTHGQVTLDNYSIAGEKPFRVNRRGIAAHSRISASSAGFPFWTMF